MTEIPIDSQSIERISDHAQNVRRSRLRFVRTVIEWVLFVVVCAGAWSVASPVQLGGPATYVIVSGTSMVPTYHDGDLVIARAAESYKVGDIVTYRPYADQTFSVVHRIVSATPDGQYTTQGDNRTEADGWVATKANILGASWIHIPYAGSLVGLTRKPVLWLAIASALIAMGLVTRRKRGPGDAPPGKKSRRTSQAGTTATMLILVLSAAVISAKPASASTLVVNAGVLQEFRVEVRLSVPDAEAGPAQRMSVGERVVLDGRGSSDPDGDCLAFRWTLAGPAGSTAALDDPASATPGFVPDVSGDYVATLVVTDPSGLYSSDMTTITALPSEPTGVPYRLEPGASKSLHWGPGDDGPASGEPIAQRDSSGALFLDFGEAPAGHGDSRPDVFRMVSLADGFLAVTFDVTGSMADFISLVRLGDGTAGLDARDTQRVYMKIQVPEDAMSGTCTGTLVVHVQGWAEDVLVPMTIEVVDKKGRNEDPPADAIEVFDPGDEGTAPVDPSAEATRTPAVSDPPAADTSSGAPPELSESGSDGEDGPPTEMRPERKSAEGGVSDQSKPSEASLGPSDPPTETPDPGEAPTSQAP